MRPIKIISDGKEFDGFLHAFVPDETAGALAVVEYVRDGHVDTVPVTAIKFEPTTKELMRQQMEAQRQQEEMMRLASGRGVPGGQILVPR